MSKSNIYECGNCEQRKQLKSESYRKLHPCQNCGGMTSWVKQRKAYKFGDDPGQCNRCGTEIDDSRNFCSECKGAMQKHDHF